MTRNRYIITFGVHKNPTYFSFRSKKRANMQKKLLKRRFPDIKFNIVQKAYPSWTKRRR